MIRIEGDWYGFCTVAQRIDYDSTGNPILAVTIGPGPWKDDIESKLAELSGQLTLMLERDLAEIGARQASPTLQDAWDKYQTLLKLTQNGNTD